MNQVDIEKFLLDFEASEMKIDDKNNLHLFEINFNKLNEIWKAKNEEYSGDFEEETAHKILNKIESTTDETQIFAIIHNDSAPLKVEMRTGRQLANVLRERHESVVPSKLMNEKEWNMIIGSGQVPQDEILDLFRLSYRLVTES